MKEKENVPAKEKEMSDMVPPQAMEIERAVLGACLIDQDAFSTVSGIVSPESFYEPNNRLVYSVIADLNRNNKPVDILTVTQSLNDRGWLESVGGAFYVIQLTSEVAGSHNVEHWSYIVAEKYFQRQSITRARQIINACYSSDETDSIADLWRKSENELSSIFTSSDTGSGMAQVIGDTIREIESDVVAAREQRTPGITTGFPSLDVSTGGWRDGNMIILAARPGVGKTSFALHFALSAAKAGFWVNFFSLEMNKEDLMRILISAESGIYRSNIRDGFLKDEDWHTINDAVTKLERLPIVFKDAAGMTINQIQSAIRKNRKNGRCDIAIIDYLQLVKSSQAKSVRELEVSEISRTMKTIALNEGIPVMALSQLNRAADGETPKLSNLRESGAIEQDADLVLFLHRPNQEQSIIRLSVAKHRRGRLGEIDIRANDEMTRFSETEQITAETVNEPF
ncbi:MAG: replicative DNA helicase [Mangrovibacterium sp.]